MLWRIKSLDPAKSHGANKVSIRMIEIWRDFVVEALMELFENDIFDNVF